MNILHITENFTYFPRHRPETDDTMFYIDKNCNPNKLLGIKFDLIIFRNSLYWEDVNEELKYALAPVCNNVVFVRI